MKNRLAILFLVLLAAAASSACVFFWLATQTPRPELVFDPTALPDGQLGVTYEAEVHVSQNVTPVGEFYLVEGTLPPGLELVQWEGENAVRITGAPAEAGTYSFILGVWCYGTSVNGQMGTQEYSLVIE